MLRATSSELQFSGFQAAYATSFFRSSSSAPGDGEEDEEALKPEAVLSLLKARFYSDAMLCYAKVFW